MRACNYYYYEPIYSRSSGLENVQSVLLAYNLCVSRPATTPTIKHVRIRPILYAQHNTLYAETSGGWLAQIDASTLSRQWRRAEPIVALALTQRAHVCVLAIRAIVHNMHCMRTIQHSHVSYMCIYVAHRACFCAHHQSLFINPARRQTTGERAHTRIVYAGLRVGVACT